MNSNDNSKKPARKSTFDVYVGHVPKDIQEDTITKVFSPYGEVSGVLCRYGDQYEYGYAIVKFKYQQDADRVLKEVDKVSVNGYEMEVRNGKKNSHSVENGDGPVHGKSVSFMEPMRDMLPIREYAYACQGANSDRNGPQLPVMIEIMCTSVENAVTFYGCPIFRCDELQNLSMKINSICPNLMRLLRKPGMRKVYGALYTEDMSWYRCCVIQCSIPTKPGVCFVEYIDYGNVDEVSYTNMVDLPEPLKKIPPFAHKCILSNLICNPKSHCDISYLHHLVNQRMSLCAMSSWGIPEYHVVKCSSNGIDVISELVRNGFAVFKSQRPQSSKPPLLPTPEKGNSRVHENSKPKKGNATKSSLKKSSGMKDAHNHLDKHSEENSNHRVRGSQNGVHTDLQNEVPNDFVPKKIIKRGDASSMGVLPLIEGGAKVKDTVNHLLKVDCVLSNLKLVNNVRDLVSLTSDDKLISDAVDLLLCKVNASEDSRNDVEKAYKEYNEVLNEIKYCPDKGLLSSLKVRREILKTKLSFELVKFLQSFDSSLLDKKKIIQNVITNLESNSNAWMNVYLSSEPATVEELLAEYNKEKDNRWNVIQKARENTNEKHKRFMELLTDFQKEFSLNMSEGNCDFLVQLGNTQGKRGSWGLKFEETLSDLGAALDEEMKTCTVVKGQKRVCVIQCILDKLDIPKEKVDDECEVYEKYKSLYDDLQNMCDLDSIFKKLAAVQEEICNFNLLCGSSEVSKEAKDFSHFSELHAALSKEDALLGLLAKASSLHFPELIIEHPEFNLEDYQKNWYLMKHSWRANFFPVLETCARLEPSYLSKLADQPVVIKEFEFENEAEKTPLTKKAIVWNEIKSKSLAKITALFNKDEKTICVMLPNVSRTFFENPLPVPIGTRTACGILHHILIGLKDIHSRGMAHGAVHPLAILHQDGEIVLDFNYDLRQIKSNSFIKGINFRAPSGEDMCKSADMYGFGCLVLWILFPNLSFTSTDQGVPNLSAFQSILEDLLSSKDFASLAALLNVNPDLRPSSRKLISTAFLKDLRIVSEASS